ncbi:hypothetical protein GCM10022280_16770 [Sphingomonas swuensis]|uniref:2-phospho-L-lactate transferase n=1 Tax=Sphingomonas swuensis TaxID=977800 RepID=A0ABP7SY14_9SPHN
MLNVVVLNGGRGAASLIPALLDRPGLNVTSIVNAYDDGKSTGEIRRFFNMLGPSDIRKVQSLMLPEGPKRDVAEALFDVRFPLDVDREELVCGFERFVAGGEELAGVTVTDPVLAAALRRFVGQFLETLLLIEQVRSQQFNFADCSLMNCLYAGAYLDSGRDMERTTRTIDRLFRLKGTVLPNSVENKWLAAVRQNGEVLSSEAEIVELRSNVLIDSIYLLDAALERSSFDRLSEADQRLYLERHQAPAIASAGVRLALAQADIVIYSAGTQHSSLYPTYLSRGLPEAIARNRSALKVFVTNIGADYETPTYRAADYLHGAYRYLCLAEDRHHAPEDLFDAVLVNNGRRKADTTYVDYDDSEYRLDVPRIVDDFEHPELPGRHNGERLVSTMLDLYAKRDLAK